MTTLATVYWTMLIGDSRCSEAPEITEEYQKRILVILDLVTRQYEITLPTKAAWSANDFDDTFTAADLGLILGTPAEKAFSELRTWLKLSHPT